MFARLAILLFAISAATPAYADKQRVGDWTFDLGPRLSEATTHNESGSIFGLICAPESCLFYLNTGSTCESGTETPVVVNFDTAAALPTTMKCMILGDGEAKHYSVFTDVTDLAKSVASDSELAIAIPMVGGQFKVVRFSLKGAKAATGSVIESVIGKDKTSPASARDATL